MDLCSLLAGLRVQENVDKANSLHVKTYRLINKSGLFYILKYLENLEVRMQPDKSEGLNL